MELGGNIYPFLEENLSNNSRIRTFPAEVWPEDLVWHRDAEDRTIKVISSNGWQLHMDNELPKDLISDAMQSLNIKEVWRFRINSALLKNKHSNKLEQ
mgnify:CR=1 FL=1